MTPPSRLLEDDLERPLEVAARPGRIVSLVPSVTELLFELGAGDRVAGVSRYCTEPAAALAQVPRIGGQKDPDVDAIVALAPDLVLAVKEENLERDVDALAARGVPVYVADVNSVEDALALVGTLCDLVDGEPARADAVRAEMTAGVAHARRIASATGAAPLPLFCPVWRDPWITIAPGTYMFDLLRTAGGDPLTPSRRHGARYPKVRLDEVRAARPRLVLLPDEPYPFGPADAALLADLAPARLPVHLVDGKALAWYGRRLAGIAEVARLIAEVRDAPEGAQVREPPAEGPAGGEPRGPAGGRRA